MEIDIVIPFRNDRVSKCAEAMLPTGGSSDTATVSVLRHNKTLGDTRFTEDSF